jgi:hypothetical protein
MTASQASMYIDPFFQNAKKYELQHKGKPQVDATHSRIVKMDFSRLQQKIKNIYALIANVNEDVFIQMPLPDGATHTYRMVENDTMSAGLAAKFPDVRTFNGYGVDHTNEYVKFDVTPLGFHAMILSPGKSDVFIDPYYKNNTSYYIVYKKSDYQDKNGMYCGVHDAAPMSSFQYYNNHHTTFAGFQLCFHRQYRVAVAGTVEYSAFFGGQAQAQAAIVTSINRINGVFETDFGVTMNLIPNNSNIVFNTTTNSYASRGATPYNPNDSSQMIAANQANTDLIIGSGNYDIGHVYAQTNTNAGLASTPSICNNTAKAQGVSGGINPTGIRFDIDFAAHEFGHQFGANHVQNNNCNRNPITSVEPGSGSTIMGYAGICPPNVQTNSNDYFNGINLQEIGAILDTQGGSCGTQSPIAAAPIVAPVANITLPISTPFALTGSATGAGSTSFTYTWEQQNPESTTQPPVSTATGGPNFRSQPGKILPTRYFPSLATLVNNGPFTWEVLPSVARLMKFRETVRSNRGAGSCNAYTDMNIVFTATAGPFTVAYPTDAGVQWQGGAQEAIQWNVANTNSAPVNAATVNILLSIDGGLTYPQTLAANVANNGLRAITVPQVTTTTARIMVQASNGKFFNISENNFRITANGGGVTAPTYTSAIRNPLDKTTAFVYYSNLGNVVATDQLTVNGLVNATAVLDAVHSRFVINSIITPRQIKNINITVTRNGASATSNTFTIPSVL